ncbi:MAG: FtsX-like permease family protein [Pirellulaceae bacterium]
MSSWRFIVRSLTHHWRINFAVALGVMAATAVLTGALLVGDSVRGSLRHLTLDRLGRIDEVLVVDRFFRQALATDLAEAPGFKDHFDSATPAILFPSATVETVSTEAFRRSAGVLVIGSTDDFWKLGDADAAPKTPPGEDQIVLNQPLADDLGVKQGDTVALRVGKLSQVAADSALGRKSDQVESLPRLEVADIVPAESLGRFSMRPSQSLPRNAYVSLATLQEALDQDEKINAILVAGESAERPPGEPSSMALAKMLQPSLEDYGLTLNLVTNAPYKDPESGELTTVFEYFNLTSNRLMIGDDAAKAIENALAADHAQPTLTYLANLIEKVRPADDATDPSQIPPGIAYSTITAVDSTAGLGPLLDEDGKPIGPLGEDEIVLNRWAAEYQEVKVGDKVRVLYFEPESSHGENVETEKIFTVRAIVPLTTPASPYRRNRPATYDKRPTLVNDPGMTPEVEGITDQDSIGDWDAPFEVDYDRVKSADDEYWADHRLTPKAFVSLDTGQRLWGSRFGHVTSFRIPRAAGKSVEQQREALTKRLLSQFNRDGVKLGFEFVPVKREQLAASSGTTPFDGLFLGLSMFLIAAALMLVALLFKLGVERRASEVGTLLAMGLRRRHVSLLLAGEGLLVSLVGGLFGAAIGVGYAALMVYGLRTWWVGAITTPFLDFYWTPASLAIGYASGVLVCVLTIAWSIWQMRRAPVRRLLAGQAGETGGASGQIWSRWATLQLAASVLLLLLAVVLAYVATRLGGEAQAGAFMGSGASVLTATLLGVWLRMRYAGGSSRALAGRFALPVLSMRNARRNPSRSTLTIGLIAAASFLIVSISAFRLAPTSEGTGGFNLMAQSSLPIFANLNTADGRKELLADRAGALQDATILSLRLQPGDDASCNNLYRSSRPRVLGVTPGFVDYFDNPDVQQFGWAASALPADAETDNAWRVLHEPPDAETGAIPVVIDKNTAMYSLQLYYGVGEEFDVEYEDGRTVKFRVAGLLSNSVLQGSLLIGEENFEKAYPLVSGYRYFLIKTPPEKQTQAIAALEDRLGDQGFDAVESVGVLEGLLAVQNTYLSTFQSLGALGLLLGTFGLATVQLRNVLERRGELALMRAEGFRRRRLAGMVLMENVVLLLGGLGVGVFCAALAVFPHFLSGGATPPWLDLSWMLGIVLVVGLLTGLAAVRATLRAPLVAALRGE